jgi:Xaa-Pro aminopeptidase
MKIKRKPMISCLSVVFLLAATPTYAAAHKGFSPKDYKDRRERLSAQITDGVAIVVNYSGVLARTRTDPEFLYLTGVDTPGAKLVIIPKEIAAKSNFPGFWTTTLYLPSKNPRGDVWDDMELYPGEKAEKETGIANTANLSAFSSDVAKLGNITDTIYLSLNSNVMSLEQLPSNLEFVNSIKKILPHVKIKNLSPLLDDMRWKKSPREIEVMKRAVTITAEAFKEAARFTKPGLHEYEIEALINYIFRIKGSQRAAFLIIASGPNSCILHHMNNDRQMVEGDLLKIDVGTVYETMSTDLTRTIPVSGKFSPEQRKIYEIVLKANKKAISIVKPGVTLAEVHRVAYEVIDEADYAEYFIHGTSHTLNGGPHARPESRGIALSGTYGRYKMNRYYALDNPLVPGSMFTIEPGIYIPEKNIGIRIEDDILVTDTGYEVLTESAPKEIDAIEKLMQEKTIYIKE